MKGKPLFYTAAHIVFISVILSTNLRLCLSFRGGSVGFSTLLFFRYDVYIPSRSNSRTHTSLQLLGVRVRQLKHSFLYVFIWLL
jgi:hypothetical protein